MKRSARCHATNTTRWLLAAMMPLFVVLPAFAATQKYLLVDNYTSKNILRYDLSTGAFVDELVSAGTGRLANPTGMTIGVDGSLYVSSYTDGRQGSVLRFNAHTGKYLGVFASMPGRSIPMEPAFGPDGDLYVSDYQNKVFRFDGVTGAPLGTFASGAPSDSFRDLAWGPDGHLYVANFSSGRVDRFDGVTGALIGSLGSAPHTQTADDLAFGPDGLLYVSEYWSRGVDAYDHTTGAFVKSLDSPQLSDSNGLVFDNKGALYVTSLFSNTIVKFNGNSDSLFAQGSPLGNPQDMVITSVPEPATMALFVFGCVALGLVHERRRMGRHTRPASGRSPAHQTR